MNEDIAQARETIRRCRELRQAGSVEAVLRGEFHSRLRLMFGDQGDERWINHYSEGTEAGTKIGQAEGGVANRFIDNLVGSTTIEYESDLRIAAKRELGLSQVREHVAGLIRSGVSASQVRGVLSDTVEWHAYDAKLVPGIDPAACTPEQVTLLAIDELRLEANDASSAARLIVFVRRHLARERSRVPRAAFLALDFGLESACYRRSASLLLNLIDDGRGTDPSIMLATDLWSQFVDYLEGEADEFRASAYLDEVYVCVLSRLISANVLTGRALSSGDVELKSILDGSFFKHRFQLANMVEQDYFGWLTDTKHVERLVPIARQMQEDLCAYDFSQQPEEDLFGRLMAQLARRSQRKLLGQEWTPAWLGGLLAERCFENLPDGQEPRIVDMCCGSGSMLAEVLKVAKARFGFKNMADLQDVATGFDIDPLAVSLAKTTWVISLVDEIKAATAPIVIPIYHADSLFSVTPVTKDLPFFDERETVPVTLDGTTIELPAVLVRPDFREFFDRVIDWAHDEAIDAEAEGTAERLTEQGTAQFIEGAATASGVTLDMKLRRDLGASALALARRMAELAIAGRNGIWAFILRNTYRPGLLSGQFNGLVSNPPWLALSSLANNPYRGVLTRRVDAYGIRPSGQSFLHLELGTTHLLHAVDRYLSSGASVACLVPGTILNGDHHELFRQRRFLNAKRRVPLEINEVWQVEHGTFKYPGAAIIGHKRASSAGLFKTSIRGFLAGQESLEETDFSINTIGDRRTAWVLENVGLPVFATDVSDVPKQGADLMPRTAVCIDILKEAGHEFRVNTPGLGTAWAFTVKAAKELKGKHFPGHVAPQFIHRIAQSENLLPFVLGEHCAPIAIPAMRVRDGAWKICDEAEIRRMGFIETARRFRAINTSLKRVGKGASLQERIDVRSKLTRQVFGTDGYLILAGAGGKHICAACVSVTGGTGLVVDQTLYWRYVPRGDEAWYCVGMLSSRAMTEAIKPFNPKGAFGERHIHTLPYRLMPEFDADKEEHIKVANLTRLITDEATNLVAGNEDLLNPNKALAGRRTWLRERLWATAAFKELDGLCSIMLGASADHDRGKGDA